VRAVERGVPLRSAGWVSGERRWELLKEASLLAVPSTWPEPFGLVGLEAAALGVPAVAFDVGGIREWLRPGVNGYLAPGDPPTSSGLAAALVEAFSAPDELRLRGCRALGVAREMSLGRHLDRLESVFASVSPQ
jgi:glycosyltransferase involved in cell wall biosynthesis